MERLKVIAVIVLVVVAGVAYFLWLRYLPDEKVFSLSKSLTRVLAVDLKVKSNGNFPTFLPKDSGFLVIHPSQWNEDHSADKMETRDIFDLLAKKNKNTVGKNDEFYAELEILFLQKTVQGLRANYVSLATVRVKSIFFYPDYLSQFSALYQDALPHAAGYMVMADGSQRLIHDILVRQSRS